MLVNLAEILKIAEEKKMAVGMFNATGFDSLQAVITAAEKLDQQAMQGVLCPEDFYTDPAEAKEFCEETGVDALAIAFGTAHGFYTAQPQLDFDVVKNVAASTGLPLVMHGGSGVSEEGFRQAIQNGIRKINYYSYMSKAGYEAAKASIASGKSGYLHDVEYAAMPAMKEDVKKVIQIFSKQ